MYYSIGVSIIAGRYRLETQETNEKKVWIKPQLIVYGGIDELTTEAPPMTPSSV